jgi:hypothetical protein
VSDWHGTVTSASHIRALNLASVSAEGGGTSDPTLGGGTGFTRDTSTVVGASSAVVDAPRERGAR